MPQLVIRPFMAAENAVHFDLRQGRTETGTALCSAAVNLGDGRSWRINPILVGGLQEHPALNAVGSQRVKDQRRADTALEPAGCVMSFDSDPKSPFDLDLRPVEAPGGEADLRMFFVLPALDILLGVPAFGQRDPIALPGARRPLNGWAEFGSARARGFTLH
jgi:hypothetical protein